MVGIRDDRMVVKALFLCQQLCSVSVQHRKSLVTDDIKTMLEIEGGCGEERVVTCYG